jgi:hypothetical protein
VSAQSGVYQLSDDDRAWAARLAAEAPPLTQEQRDQLAGLLSPFVCLPAGDEPVTL